MHTGSALFMLCFLPPHIVVVRSWGEGEAGVGGGGGGRSVSMAISVV